jgi:hypothetical protein
MIHPADFGDVVVWEAGFVRDESVRLALAELFENGYLEEQLAAFILTEKGEAQVYEAGFSPFVQERLGFYVYLLSDPRDRKIFYVGKGKGNRIFAHAKDALAADEQKPSDKLDRIRDIHRSGHQVAYELLRFGLNEKTAFDVEAASIQLLGLDDLTNLVGGHHVSVTGRMTVDVAVSLFDAAPAPEITEPALLIKIPKLWYPAIPPEDLFEATAGWWAIGERRNKAEYAMSVNHGVIREVYRIHSWRKRKEGDREWQDDIGKKPRWGFEGEVAENMAHYRNHSVRHLYKTGDRNPIRFINC